MLIALDLAKLSQQLTEKDTWIVLVAVAFAGVLGGLARKLTASTSNTETTVADVTVGAVTALAMLMVIPAQEIVTLLATSIVSGFTGKSLLDGLRARAEALVAQRQAEDAKAAAVLSDEKRKDAVQKGLAAVQKAREIVTTADAATHELAGSLPPDMLAGITKRSRLFIKTSDETKPLAFHADAFADLSNIEASLNNLM
jgi:hypothetical protein